MKALLCRSWVWVALNDSALPLATVVAAVTAVDGDCRLISSPLPYEGLPSLG